MGAVSDRFCVIGEKVTLSPQTVISCNSYDNSCGGKVTNACGGGSPGCAYATIASRGVTTCTNQCTSGCEPYGSGSNTCHGAAVVDVHGQLFADDVLKDQCHGCDEQCHDGSTARLYKTTSAVRKGQNSLNADEETVKAQLRTHGSVTGGLSVYANWHSWVEKHGADAVYDTHGDSAHLGGHVITISGYGISGGKKYWLVRNSWGSGFGDGGYIKMLRGDSTVFDDGSRIMWEDAQWATPVHQSIFAPEPLSDVSPIEETPDEFPITGGWFTADHSHPYFRGLAQTAFHQTNTLADFVNLTKVEMQLVNGFNVFFSLETTWGPLRIETQHDFDGTLRGPPLVASLVV